MIYLEWAAPGGSRTFALRPGVHVVGRSADAGVQVADASLSRRHAEIRVEGDAVAVLDLGSHNGTLLNGRPVSGEARACAGDTLQCGDVVLVLRAAPPAAAPGMGGPQAADPARTVSLRADAPGGDDAAGRRLSTLLRVAQLLARPDENLQRRILDLAAEILPIDRAVLLAAGEDGALTVAASTARTATFDRPYSESIVRYVLERRVAGQFDDAQADGRLGAAPSLVAQSIRCAMCAPLVADDRVLGAIYVDNLVSAHSFEAGELELLAGFANQAALAMHNAALQAQARQAALRQHTFERFFPRATAARLLESGGDLGVEELSVTSLFSDISGFTAMSEEMKPAEVVTLLHAYFPEMARIVFARDGTLEKYIGDALMAVWGAPFGHPDDADRALEAAVEMQEAVARMRSRLPRPIGIHVGLHSGVAALANIGSEEYLQVATIGDATNTAARVCGAAGECEIVITRATADRLTHASWPLTALPRASLKGRSEPIDLFRVEWRP